VLSAALNPRPRLVFTTGVDPYQLLIKVGTRSPATHVAIGLGDHLLHAYEVGVVVEPRDYWFGDEMQQQLIAEFVVLPDVSVGLHHAWQKIGQKYDVAGAFKIGLLRALRALGSPVRSLGKVADDAHTCACFAMLLDTNGLQIPEWRGIDRELVVPGDLLNVCDGPSFARVA
jgi:hypothetical protein